MTNQSEAANICRNCNPIAAQWEGSEAVCGEYRCCCWRSTGEQPRGNGPTDCAAAGAGPTTPWDFWRSIGCPRYVVAPMVEQSELAFRMMTRNYGAELVYTQMLHSRIFSESADYRNRHFQTCAGDSPLIAQFSGDDAVSLIAAARCIQSDVSAVDINFGCPQGIAKRGHYGAFLLDDPDLVERLVRKVSQHIAVPLTVKLRKVNQFDVGPTVKLCQRLESVGAAALCLHGRCKEEKCNDTSRCDWDVVALVKRSVGIPVIANGGVETLADAEECLTYTNADAVMCAEAILQNPLLFSGIHIPQCEIARDYLTYCDRYGIDRPGTAKAHLFRILHAELPHYPSLRDKLATTSTLDECRDVTHRILSLEREKADGALAPLPERSDFGYYRRHRKCNNNVNNNNNHYYYKDYPQSNNTNAHRDADENVYPSEQSTEAEEDESPLGCLFSDN